jgi:hypothetical protein
MGIHIGDNNKIKKSTLIGGNRVDNSRPKSEKSAVGFWTGVWQSILTNLIWWIIATIIIVVIGIFTATNWSEITAFIMNR